MVWTVNEPDHMMEVTPIFSPPFHTEADNEPQAVRWEVDAILTDVTKTWLDLRTALRCGFPYLEIES